MRRIGLNLMRPDVNTYQRNNYAVASNNFNTFLNQGQKFSGFNANGFNSMISQVVNSKPGCSSCGK